MKNLKLLMILFVAIAISTAYSCKKDDDTDDGTGDGSSNSCMLVKQTNDDGTYVTIEYNSDNLVVKVKEYTDAGIETNIMEFSYANKNLMKMEMSTAGIVGLQYVYSYDAQGHPDTSKMFSNQGGTMILLGFTTFSFSGDNISSASMFIDVAGNIIESSKKEFTYSNDNVATMKEYSSNGTSLNLSLTYEYEYDGKTNPLYSVGLEFLDVSAFFMSKENITKETIKDDQGVILQDESMNTVYEYKSSKYPTKQTSTSFDNSETEVSTMNYDCK